MLCREHNIWWQPTEITREENNWNKQKHTPYKNEIKERTREKKQARRGMVTTLSSDPEMF